MIATPTPAVGGLLDRPGIPRRAMLGGIILTALFGGVLLSVASRHGSSYRPVRSSGAFSPRHAAVTFGSEHMVVNGAATAAPARQSAPRSATSVSGTPTSSLPSNVIETADLTLLRKRGHVGTASNRAVLIAQSLGGYVSFQTRANHDTRLQLQVRVPAPEYAVALRRIRSLGTVTSENDQTQDVGLQVVDLGARLKNLGTQRSQLLRLFAHAKSVADTIRIEHVLSGVQGQIEQTQARMRYLKGQIQMATITLTVASKMRTHHRRHHTFLTPIANAFEAAGSGFINVVAAAIVVVGYAIPLALLMFVALGLFVVARGIYRRLPHRHGATTPSAA